MNFQLLQKFGELVDDLALHIEQLTSRISKIARCKNENI